MLDSSIGKPENWTPKYSADDLKLCATRNVSVAPLVPSITSVLSFSLFTQLHPRWQIVVQPSIKGMKRRQCNGKYEASEEKIAGQSLGASDKLKTAEGCPKARAQVSFKQMWIIVERVQSGVYRFRGSLTLYPDSKGRRWGWRWLIIACPPLERRSIAYTSRARDFFSNRGRGEEEWTRMDEGSPRGDVAARQLINNIICVRRCVVALLPIDGAWQRSARDERDRKKRRFEIHSNVNSLWRHGGMADTEKKYTTAYGRLRRLTSTIDGQIRQISVSSR